MISFGDFQKLEIKIGKIKKAEKVEGADRLLKLTVDTGGEERTLASSIAEYYTPEELKGRKIPILTNLEPKTFMGVESQGMLLCVDIDGEPILIEPEKDVPAGSRVR